MQELTGRFLIAMPTMDDPRFIKTVAYICEHTAQSTMALIINQPLPIQLSRIVEGMDIDISNGLLNDIQVNDGGPVQPGMGCVIHPRGDSWNSTFNVGDISITTSKDILTAIAANAGPKQAMVMLGYVGWTKNQLEQELEDNMWLTSKADSDIIFTLPAHKRWHAALAILGIDPVRLSAKVGHA